MTIGIIQLTENSRKFLLKFSVILSSTELILGIVEVIMASYMFTTLSIHLNGANKERSMQLSFYTICFGMSSILISIINTKMSLNCAAKPPMKRIRNYHNFWIILSVIFIVLNISYIFCLSEIFDSLERLIIDTFIHGIFHYLTDETWKKTFDYFQTQLKCCGINKYTDWYEIPWISLADFPQNKKRLTRYERANGKVNLPIVPTSCCRTNIPKSKCTSDLAQQLVSENIEAVPSREIYPIGCIQLIDDTLSHIAISTGILESLITTLQFSIIVTCRYLYTSSRNSLLMGDPNGTAPGWLFKRANCSFIKRQPLFPSDKKDSTIVICSESNKDMKCRKSNKKIKATKEKLHLTFKSDSENSETDSGEETPPEKKKKLHSLKNKLQCFKRHKSNMQNNKTDEREALMSRSECKENKVRDE